MNRRNTYHKRHSTPVSNQSSRLRMVFLFFCAFGAILMLRLFYLQVIQHGFYEALASGQRELYQDLFPERGDILVRDQDGEEVALATNRYLNLLWADTREIEDPGATYERVAEWFGFEEKISQEREEQDRFFAEFPLDEGVDRPLTETEALAEKIQGQLAKEDDPYEPLIRRVTDELADQIREENVPGIRLLRERFRYYPEDDLAAHVVGFVSEDEDGSITGKYGVEGYFEEQLAGTQGYLFTERDSRGRVISIGNRNTEPAEDGADIVLTIDRTIQYMACESLERAVDRYQADGGSVAIMHPKTGAIMAMCTVPDFDPNAFNKVESIEVYNNQVTYGAYEPGSIFKPLVMAAAIDVEAVTPSTQYEDLGEEKIDQYTIRNSDLKAHGWQDMTEVLDKSLNLGMIFVMRQMGGDVLADYVHQFGFGERTNVKIDTEVGGVIQSVDRGGEIYSATASYGQGITVTPLQMLAAYGAVANGGMLLRPRIVQEIRHASGVIEQFGAEQVRQVISPRTAQTISAMLVSVVEGGHGGNAGVGGYFIAGKTGTAQVADRESGGYRSDATIASFAGFGPIEDPQFVMIVRIDHPRTSPWAASTAAPTFQEIASFLLQYLNVPPGRLE